jgi:hypothetical protein
VVERVVTVAVSLDKSEGLDGEKYEAQGVFDRTIISASSAATILEHSDSIERIDGTGNRPKPPNRHSSQDRTTQYTQYLLVLNFFVSSLFCVAATLESFVCVCGGTHTSRAFSVTGAALAWLKA